MTQANYVQRLRLRFSKVGPTRFIGHLDVARALERALNRTQIPLAYTQGYNPRPRMQFANALPLGFTSDGELADIWLKEKMDPESARSQMMTKMAPGIIVDDVWEVPLELPAMQAMTLEAGYTAELPQSADPAIIARRAQAMLASATIMRERRGKQYDLRPLIHDLVVSTTDSGTCLAMRLALQSGATGRPDEVLLSLGVDPLDARVHRTEIVLEDEGKVR